MAASVVFRKQKRQLSLSLKYSFLLMIVLSTQILTPVQEFWLPPVKKALSDKLYPEQIGIWSKTKFDL